MLKRKKENFLLSHGQELVLSNYLTRWPELCDFYQVCHLIKKNHKSIRIAEPFKYCKSELLISHMAHLSSMIDKAIVETIK